MRVLILGDVVGRPARRAVRDLVPALVKNESIDLVVANAENPAGGIGVDIKSAKDLLSAGVHVLTSGNHIWKKKEIYSFLDEHEKLIRPANYPAGAPGRGWCLWRQNDLKAIVINIQGRVFMPNHVDDPFRCVDDILKEHGKEAAVIIVDMHAEATSEKIAMGWYLDGRVSVVYGTHTHVQTADERILHLGTAYITDLGMTGSYGGVIGMKKGDIINRFMSPIHRKPDHSKGEVRICGAVVDVDEATGRARSIERINLEHNQ